MKLYVELRNEWRGPVKGVHWLTIGHVKSLNAFGIAFGLFGFLFQVGVES